MTLPVLPLGSHETSGTTSLEANSSQLRYMILQFFENKEFSEMG
jgi:hypothetical protein